MDSNAVVIEDLKKRYDDVEALKGISFEIKTGEVFGLLGPNGAGKTTTVEILEGLRAPDSGRVQVLGLDPSRQNRALKERIGACLQSTVLQDKITVSESLELYGAFYAKRADPAKLLDLVGLDEKKSAYFDHLSGGQKQRLALALALVNDPELIFFDEPTTGLDAQVRREIHDLIRALKQQGRTVLLTTHYIEEAERLCDRVAIIDRGQIIALGTPRELVARSAGASAIELQCEKPISIGVLRSLEQVQSAAEMNGAYHLRSANPAHTVVALSRLMEESGNELIDLHITRPTLEDVFIELTGRRIRE